MVITNNMTMITMETLIIVMLITMETMITMMKIPLKTMIRMVTIAIPLKAMITIAKTTMRGIQELMERLHTGQL